MTRRPFDLRLPFLVVAAALLTAGFARADGPRADLVRLVPEDVTFCLVIGDLRGHAEKLQQPAWLKKLKTTPFGQELAAALEGPRLGRLGELLEKRLGVTWQQLRDDVLGDAVVMAYKPGPKPADDEGLLLLHARDPKLLGKLLDRLNAEQKKSGELKALEARQYQGVTYHRRVEVGEEQFYYLQGPLLAFASHEAVLKRVLDRRAAKPGGVPPLLRHLRQAGAEAALATLWLNPRGLDAELRDRLKELQGPQAHGLAMFLRYWEALDGVSMSVTLAPEPVLSLALAAPDAKLPPALARLVKETAQPSELWSRFPKDSLLTIAGRVDMPALVEVLQEWVPPELRPDDRKARPDLGTVLGKQLAKDVLPHLGPDCGLCVLPAADPKAPPQLLLAVRVRPGPKGGVDRTLYQALQFLIALGVAEHNKNHGDHIRMATTMQDKVEVKYLVDGKRFPKGFRPAFALKEGYLVVASTPEAVGRFAAGPMPLPPTPHGTPLARLSLRVLARLVKDQREPVLGLIGEKYGLPPQLAGDVLDGLLGGWSALEDLELTQRSEAGRTLWLVRLRTRTAKE